MKRFALVPLFALAIVGCSDRRQDQPQLTEPNIPPISADLMGVNMSMTGEATGSSTVCDAYQVSLSSAKAELEKNSGDATLQQKVTTFEEIVADACDN